jgi:hypothetical protein
MRPRLLRNQGPPPRSKRFLTACDVAEIVQKYESGNTTQEICALRGISKTRVATVLREQGITIRRQGLTEEQANEATGLYIRSFICVAWRSVPRIPHNRSHRASAAGDPIAAATRLDLDFAAPADTWFCPASAG